MLGSNPQVNPQGLESRLARKVKSDEPIYRQMDPGKVVGGCDGYFAPPQRQRQESMRVNKTEQDRMPVAQRPRVEAAKKRTEKMRRS